HQQDVHNAQRPPHPGLHYGPLRLTRAPSGYVIDDRIGPRRSAQEMAIMMEHTIKAFDADLQELARMIAEMGGLAERQIGEALDALNRHDAALARSVIAADAGIDSLQREIEEKSILTIARRQPMAVDLREIVAALRVSNDLERIGDLAKNIAKRVEVVENN